MIVLPAMDLAENPMPQPACDPVRIPTRSIPLSRIDSDALKVIRRLRRFGHTAYLVGGCVRDLLLKRNPKDFDVATSARPSEIKKLFRNCRLIGRRFRLAHIHFRDKIIETATFRANNAEGPSCQDLFIRSDNVFGTEEEDSQRRDFTINALFFDPESSTLVDHVGGLEDLVSRTIRFIGDPDIRVQEDPVRILRAIKFAARLGFEIEPAGLNAMVRYREHLQKSAPPRLLEEIVRMLRGGAAERSFQLLRQTDVLQDLLPDVAGFLNRAADSGKGFWAFLKAVDSDQRENFSGPVLWAVLLLHPYLDTVRNREKPNGWSLDRAVFVDAARVLFQHVVQRLRLPKWEAERGQQIVMAYGRMISTRSGSRLPSSLISRNYFDEALELVSIGVRATGDGQWILNRLQAARKHPGRSKRSHWKPSKAAPALARGRRRRGVGDQLPK